MNPSETVEYLQNLASKILFIEKRYPIKLTREWANSFPKKAGVYIFREIDNVIYIGETGYWPGRMNDLLDTRNHSFRRTLGKLKFSNETTFSKATTSKKFSIEIESLLNKYIISNLTVSTIEIILGRKELEEYLIDMNTCHINIKSKRIGKIIK